MDPITDPRRLLNPKPKAKQRQVHPTREDLAERRQITLRTFLFSNLTHTGIANAVAAIMTAAHANDKDKDGRPAPRTFAVDRYDVIRDLDWWKKTNAEKLAAGRTLNAGEAIGAALDFCEMLQHEAMQIYTNAASRTGANREPIHRLDRLLRTAWQFQKERLNIMFNLGLISRTTASDVAQRIGNLLDYERMIARAKARRDSIPVAPGTAKWLGDLPTDGHEH